MLVRVLPLSTLADWADGLWGLAGPPRCICQLSAWPPCCICSDTPPKFKACFGERDHLQNFQVGTLQHKRFIPQQLHPAGAAPVIMRAGWLPGGRVLLVPLAQLCLIEMYPAARYALSPLPVNHLAGTA
jgi:hypothetical protein